MRLIANGDEVEVDEQATVESLLAQLAIPDKGIAVAVDGTVLPRAGWGATLSEGSRIEVVTAVQGG